MSAIKAGEYMPPFAVPPKIALVAPIHEEVVVQIVPRRSLIKILCWFRNATNPARKMGANRAR